MKHLLFLIAILFINSSFAQKTKPELNLKIGETYFILSHASSTITQTLNSQPNNLNLTFSYKLAFKVIGIAEDVYHMEVSYQDVDMRIQVAGQTIEIDSKKKDTTDVPSTIMAAIMNKPFDVLMSKNGKVRSVEHIEKMINSVIDGFPNTDQTKKQQVKAQFLQSFGADAFKGSIEMISAIFPDAPVGKSDKWTINTILASPANAEVKTVYQLTDIVNNAYLIHGDGTMSTEHNGKAGVINGMPMKYNLTGSSITDIKIDKKTGWINELKMKQIMTGSIDVQANPQLPSGMTIPMTFNTDIVNSDK